jgi:hypothetical protein
MSGPKHVSAVLRQSAAQSNHYHPVRSDRGLELIFEFAQMLLSPKVANAVFAFQSQVCPACRDDRFRFAPVKETSGL